MSDNRRKGRAPMREDRIIEQRKASALPRHLQGHIGRQLRAVYTELVNEPVPDKITEVLEQLKAKEAGEPEE